MRLNDLSTHEELLARDLERDPALREEWDSNALARGVANHVLAFRAANQLSQSAFGRLLGMTQPQVARMETGEHTPTLDTLSRLAQALDVEFVIDVVPEGRTPRLVTSKAKSQPLVSNKRLLVAAR